jgi:hypothetical protein
MGDAGKHKANVNKPGQKKPREEFSNKSLKMGLFHVKKVTPAVNALPNNSKLKDGQGICLDFCLHEKNVTSPISYARMGSITPTGKNVPDKDKPVLLPHINKTGLMWLDAKTFKKHKQTILAEYTHLLGNTKGIKSKNKSTISNQ